MINQRQFGDTQLSAAPSNACLPNVFIFHIRPPYWKTTLGLANRSELSASQVDETGFTEVDDAS